MSRKKKKDVEFEADLKNREDPDSNISDSGINGPDNGGSVNNQEQNNDTDNKNEPNKQEEQQNQDNRSTNDSNDAPKDEKREQQESTPENRVFDKNPEELSQGDRESRVESSPPPNDNGGQDANTVDDKEDSDEANDKNNMDEKNEDASSNDSIEDNNEDNQISDDSNDNTSVTDASEMEDSKVSDTSDDQSLQDSKMGALAGKASDTMDTINKAKKFNDIKNMSKEQASKELYEVGKTVVKQKVKAAVVSAIAPYILPIVIGAIAILIAIFIIIGAMIGITQNNKPAQEGCKVVNENSSDVNIKSGDAEKNAKTIYDYEKKHVKGSTAKGRAAHLGNLYIESARTFDPKTIQGNNSFKESIAKDPSAGGYAFGIAQWDSERRVNLLKYAEKKDKKWNDFGTQLDFMLNHDGSDSDVIKGLLKKDGDIKGITEDIMNDWERAGDKSSIGQRQAAASKYYAKFSKSDGDSSSEDNLEDATDAASDNSDAAKNSGCDTSESSGKTSGKLGASVKANGGSGKVLKQWSSKDEIPEKYKKHIELPDYKGEKLDSDENVFPGFGQKGQCTELTFSYMSQLWKGKQPTNGNGNVIYKAYKEMGAKTTANPTVGYGFSSNPPYAGASTSDVGHTGVVIGVMEDGKWLMSNYNLNGEANKDQSRVETFALVDGNKKEGGATFFSGIGGPKIKSKD